jgi:hypothetical protein
MKKPKLNREWHLAHPMPKNPTMEQRIEWHLAHHKHCACRDIPDSLKQEMKQRGLSIND